MTEQGGEPVELIDQVTLLNATFPDHHVWTNWMPPGPPALGWGEMWVPFDRLGRGVFVTSSYSGGFVQSLRHRADMWPELVLVPQVEVVARFFERWRGRFRRARYALTHDADPYDW